MTLARIVFWLALAIWLGAVVFLSFVVAPSVFTALPREEAGSVMGVIFPRYYALQGIAGAIALLASAALWRAVGWTRAKSVTGLIALMLLAVAYAGAVIQPRASVLRVELHTPAPAPDAQATFDRLHRRAVQLNATILFLGIACVAVAASSGRTPRG